MSGDAQVHEAFGQGDELLEIWSDLVDPERRIPQEAEFFRKLFEHYGRESFKRGADIACGKGVTTEALFRAGLREAYGGDRSAEMLADATERIRSYRANGNLGVAFRPRRWDWMQLPRANLDVCVNMGNNLCLMDDMGQVEKAVLQHRGMLRPGGLFVTDVRNFPAIIPGVSIHGNGLPPYCGTDKVGVRAEDDGSRITMHYRRRSDGKGGSLSLLKISPFDMHAMLERHFSEVLIFNDYQRELLPNPGFYQFACVRR